MDISALAAEGLSVGEARRRDYNRVVLACLMQGFRKLRADKYADGQTIHPPQDVVRDLLLEMATGGMLFGDPAFQPFEGDPGESPVEVKTARGSERIAVTVSVGAQHLFLQCSEPLATWGKEQAPAMRLLARVPLAGDHVAEVQVTELNVGGKMAARRLIWAVEEDRGERFLHVKIVFPQPTPENFAALHAGATSVFDVVTTTDADRAQTRFVDEEPSQ
jgi:hypothetical protein